MSVLRTATRPMLEEMGLDVIHGPPNSGRAPEMLARFRAALDRDPVLVVPTGDDVAGFESQLCDQAGATLGGSISTFAALTGEITRALAADVAAPLSVAQRQALVRAAVKRAAPRLLRRSARRPGFTPALDALIAELQAALIEPAEFARMVAELDDPGYETELAAMYGAYVELRDAGGRSDPGLVATAAIAALRADPAGWGRPVFVYGFDDFGRAQLELVDALARASEVTVAVTYADRRALSVRAGLLTALEQELGAKVEPPLPFEEGYTTSRNPAPPRPQSVRGGGGPDRARRRPAAAAQRRAPWRSRGDRGRDRAAAERRPRGGRDRRRRAPARRRRSAARERAPRPRHPGGAGGLGSAEHDLRRHRADRPLPCRRRRHRRRGAAHPPALGPVDGRRGRSTASNGACAAATPRA